jgi:hypothetical protein
VGGDFNILRFFAEKNKNIRPNRFTDTFNAIIQINELREIPIVGGLYTWSNNQVDPTLEKLDRILMSKEWETLFPTVHGHKKPRVLSDHNPLVISIQSVNLGNKRDFRFELNWLQQPEFLFKVEHIWTTPTKDVNNLDRVLFKIRKLKKPLKGWDFNLAGSRKQKEERKLWKSWLTWKCWKS